MHHWSVPGVSPMLSNKLPRGPNMKRDQEKQIGTSMRDSVAFSYSQIRHFVISNSVQELREFLLNNAIRMVEKELGAKGVRNYCKLSIEERLDFALIRKCITDSQRALISQISSEDSAKTLVAVFLNFLRERQPSPLYFEPLVTLCLNDKDLFTEREEVVFLNRECIRTL